MSPEYNVNDSQPMAGIVHFELPAIDVQLMPGIDNQTLPAIDL